MQIHPSLVPLHWIVEKRGINSHLDDIYTAKMKVTVDASPDDVVSLDNCDLKPLTELPLNLRFTM